MAAVLYIGKLNLEAENLGYKLEALVLDHFILKRVGWYSLFRRFSTLKMKILNFFIKILKKPKTIVQKTQETYRISRKPGTGIGIAPRLLLARVAEIASAAALGGGAEKPPPPSPTVRATFARPYTVGFPPSVSSSLGTARKPNRPKGPFDLFPPWPQKRGVNDYFPTFPKKIWWQNLYP